MYCDCASIFRKVAKNMFEISRRNNSTSVAAPFRNNTRRLCGFTDIYHNYDFNISLHQSKVLALLFHHF